MLQLNLNIKRLQNETIDETRSFLNLKIVDFQTAVLFIEFYFNYSIFIPRPKMKKKKKKRIE